MRDITTPIKVWRVLTSLFACLFLDRLVLVNPPRHALLVRVLEAEVVRLLDVEVGEHVRQQLVSQRGALKDDDGESGETWSVRGEIVKQEKLSAIEKINL